MHDLPASCLVGTTEQGVVSLSCLPTIIGNVIFVLLVFAGVVALILIIISGFKFITSGGDPKQAEGARKTLTFAIIGLVVILLSFAIIGLIEKTTGLNSGCITKFGFDQCVPSTACSPENLTGECPPGRVCSAGICIHDGR